MYKLENISYYQLLIINYLYELLIIAKE